ncbi:serine O-acetyltransferase [Laspinema olomoucense]|uniref:Serine acetyltransferase n=1 Tax=Laspinema olomoucense D3b TaxID=2953688 RepID=A0ABT2N864_9CYAN|nr:MULTISPECIES: serine O-acetyltransferase [unclassified Laspinema]MCT7972449.1 serine O-acetyltransferase [Laspinema sp. D3d]MCT7977925.1 serine O-acetyltransferase [Laspinema sp. D3b]MCT7986993.1 serine O-acetyltransferase [Laspinema sp. D3a]MCT7994301.1 serine O-acetyltransferase [Laspinema sp. D3c]
MPEPVRQPRSLLEDGFTPESPSSQLEGKQESGPHNRHRDSAPTATGKSPLSVFNTLKVEFQNILDRDPAAKNWLEVLLCYPSLHAIMGHRVAHELHNRGIPVVPRLISQILRFFTGIEIHPGAQIGQCVFIDHGVGVVIGETAIVGNNVLIYQGVTLGGTGKEIGKRHPTLGENVVVGAGAKILGNIQIGDNVRIGAGSVVLRHIPADCTVVGVPGRIIRRRGDRVISLERESLQDPEAEAIRALFERIKFLEQEVERMKAQRGTFLRRHPLEHYHNQNGYLDFHVLGLNSQVNNQVIEDFLDGAGI